MRIYIFIEMVLNKLKLYPSPLHLYIMHTIECFNCKKVGHVINCRTKTNTEVKVVAPKTEANEVVAVKDSRAFCMQLQVMEFIAEQEWLRVKKYEKRKAQWVRGISSKMREEVQGV